MDVTPSPAMYKAMCAYTDLACGAAPGKLETTPAAERCRAARQAMMDSLHRFVALAMREGVRRYQEEMGARTQEATNIEVATADNKPTH